MDFCFQISTFKRCRQKKIFVPLSINKKEMQTNLDL